MHPAKRLILPHPDTGHRPAIISSLALGLYALFIFVSAFSFRVLAGETGVVLGYATNIEISSIVSLTNQEREKAGLSSLSVNEALSRAAEAKAQDMFADDYWAHIAPDGTTPWSFMTAQGYDFYTAGENLARDFDSSAQVVAAWMASPSHKENIVNSQYQEIGVAMVNGELAGTETTLVVQMFGTTRAAYAASLEAPSIPTVGPAAVAVTAEAPPSEVTRPAGVPSTAVSPPQVLSQITHTSVLGFLFLLIVFFVLDVAVVTRRRTVRLSGSTFAHVGAIAFIVVVVWWSGEGLVL